MARVTGQSLLTTLNLQLLQDAKLAFGKDFLEDMRTKMKTFEVSTLLFLKGKNSPLDFQELIEGIISISDIVRTSASGVLRTKAPLCSINALFHTSVATFIPTAHKEEE